MDKLNEYLLAEVIKKKDRLYLLKLLKIFFWGSADKRSVLLFRVGQTLYKRRNHKLARLFFMKLEKNYSIFINPKATIGIGLKLPHPTGIVIGAGATLGENVIIFQQVTIGGGRIGDAQVNNYPDIGNNCVLFAGAKLLGNIKIGNYCKIGANAVVIKDVPDNSVAVGIPARIINKKSVEIN
jgi:serine O-acetyltransferase